MFVLTGRLRAAAGYTARHNTIFQGLTSDGAKLALWRVWRAGYKIANFIHDQIIVEVPTEYDLKAHAEAIKGHMIAGMNEVLPDMLVDVKYAATDRWRKGAKAVFDQQGRLQLWFPQTKADDEKTRSMKSVAKKKIRSVAKGSPKSKSSRSNIVRA